MYDTLVDYNDLAWRSRIRHIVSLFVVLLAGSFQALTFCGSDMQIDMRLCRPSLPRWLGGLTHLCWPDGFLASP